MDFLCNVTKLLWVKLDFYKFRILYVISKLTKMKISIEYTQKKNQKGIKMCHNQKSTKHKRRQEKKNQKQEF